MNIGEVAELSGLPAKTIRYYEDVGFIRPQRDANGYRNFRPVELNKLAFLARARALGFTIENRRALLALWEDKARASADVKRIAHEHLAMIDAKIADLRAMRDTLSDLVTACAGDHRPDCPILQDLAHLPDRGPTNTAPPRSLARQDMRSKGAATINRQSLGTLPRWRSVPCPIRATSPVFLLAGATRLRSGVR